MRLAFPHLTRPPLKSLDGLIRVHEAASARINPAAALHADREFLFTLNRLADAPMPFDPQRGSFYRMPVFFGLTPGPRQWPEVRSFDFKATPRRRVAGVRLLGDAR